MMNSPVSINRELNVQLCYQVMQAGLDISRVFAHLARVDIPDPLKPSPLKVEETNYDGYPNVQCRLDTYIQGALSIYPPDLENKELRPSCWYKK